MCGGGPPDGRAGDHAAAETAQHPGHADIVRESLAGAKGTGQARLTRSD
ncbi:DinB family protein [Streptomyces rapamycinicus NRRL 5491]|nr:DUF664 domain-containing protein [Streptomyces rapamycinicus]UTO68266.1 DinB family protein [Streptomyces rapamycinicus]UTP37467.1 DinB family protein [Streptomyces rapamycinicus NRRL 5491]